MEEEVDIKEQIMKALDTLTIREQTALKLRFGLEDGRRRTLREVGREFKVTRERIRQIETKALRKLGYTYKDSRLASLKERRGLHATGEERRSTRKDVMETQ